MKVVDLDQDQSSDWLTWRSNGIGASDISVLMGSHPTTTPYQLWEEKCGYGTQTEVTKPMMHGIQNEPLARRWVNDMHGIFLEPLCVEDEDFSYMRASLDGWDAEQGILAEIKCPVSDSKIEAFRSTGSFPLHWFHQMQWQIMLTSPAKAMFVMWDYRSQGCYTCEVFGDTDLHKKMRVAAAEFWKQVQTGVPPALQDSDYVDVDDPELEVLLGEYGTIHEQSRLLDRRKRELKDKIVEFGDDGSFRAFGFRIKRCQNAVKYDIEQMRLDGIDIDKYRKGAGIGYYKILVPNEK